MTELFAWLRSHPLAAPLAVIVLAIAGLVWGLPQAQPPVTHPLLQSAYPEYHPDNSDKRLYPAIRKNSDTVAWLTIPGTDIDCPVMQGGNNEYYLRRDETGREDVHGCVYADYECSFNADYLSKNLVIYGHTFSGEDTGSFEGLHQYRAADFCREHPLIYLSVPSAKLTYEILSVGTCNVWEDTDCITANPDEQAFRTILEKAKSRCAFDLGSSLNTDDHILTLSTCTADNNYRLLVVARLAEGVSSQ